MWRSQGFFDAFQEEEEFNLILRPIGARYPQCVIQEVPVKRLIIVSGAGVLRLQFGCVESAAGRTRKFLSQANQTGMNGEQAEFRTCKRKRVDPPELIIQKASFFPAVRIAVKTAG